MGVISTGSIFKTLTFDGRSSSEFNVYITGEGVFNAPERAVEMISIPGRNGAFALDYGRFENIEVTYNCGIAGDDDADFASAISDFRNWLCSRNGYVRLTDDYNAGEYRMAVYKSGLEVTAENLKAGEFPVVFECKPQRFLTSGENAISVTSGDTITNPTLFESRPMLEVYGEGNINIGSDVINVSNEPIGIIQIGQHDEKGEAPLAGFRYNLRLHDTASLNNGDEIFCSTLPNERYDVRVCLYLYITFDTGFTATDDNWTLAGSGTLASTTLKRIRIYVEKTTTFGTSWNENNLATTLSINGTLNGNPATASLSLDWEVRYDGNYTVRVTADRTSKTNIATTRAATGFMYSVYGNSTQGSAGNPMYIDLDIGEAYKVEGGEAISTNNAVSIPAELPTLTPGANTIIFDNTITQLDLIPRWFKI